MTFGIFLFHDAGDKSVTMCGVAQEETGGEGQGYTRPWHVTVTSVRALDSRTHTLTAEFPHTALDSNIGTLPSHVAGGKSPSNAVFGIHRESKLGADSSSLLW